MTQVIDLDALIAALEAKERRLAERIEATQLLLNIYRAERRRSYEPQDNVTLWLEQNPGVFGKE